MSLPILPSGFCPSFHKLKTDTALVMQFDEMLRSRLSSNIFSILSRHFSFLPIFFIAFLDLLNAGVMYLSYAILECLTNLARSVSSRNGFFISLCISSYASRASWLFSRSAKSRVVGDAIWDQCRCVNLFVCVLKFDDWHRTVEQISSFHFMSFIHNHASKYSIQNLIMISPPVSHHSRFCLVFVDSNFECRGMSRRPSFQSTEHNPWVWLCISHDAISGRNLEDMILFLQTWLPWLQLVVFMDVEDAIFFEIFFKYDHPAVNHQWRTNQKSGWVSISNNRGYRCSLYTSAGRLDEPRWDMQSRLWTLRPAEIIQHKSWNAKTPSWKASMRPPPDVVIDNSYCHFFVASEGHQPLGSPPSCQEGQKTKWLPHNPPLSFFWFDAWSVVWCLFWLTCRTYTKMVAMQDILYCELRWYQILSLNSTVA